MEIVEEQRDILIHVSTHVEEQFIHTQNILPHGPRCIWAKVSFGDIHRRIEIFPSASYSTFKAHVLERFSISQRVKIKITYKDEEGDTIDLSTDAELAGALSVMKNCIKFSVLPASVHEEWRYNDSSFRRCQEIYSSCNRCTLQQLGKSLFKWVAVLCCHGVKPCKNAIWLGLSLQCFSVRLDIPPSITLRTRYFQRHFLRRSWQTPHGIISMLMLLPCIHN